MGDPKQPYRYTRGDLQRYLSGKMSADEMHLLEKAALDDPFLADALEGMLDMHGPDHEKDLQDLSQKLDEKLGHWAQKADKKDTPGRISTPGIGTPETADEGGSMKMPSAGRVDQEDKDRVIPIPIFRNPAFRMAAAIVLLIGLGLATNWLINQTGSPDATIAKTEQSESRGDTIAHPRASAKMAAIPDSAADALADTRSAEATAAGNQDNQQPGKPAPAPTIPGKTTVSIDPKSGGSDTAFTARDIAAATPAPPAGKKETDVVTRQVAEATTQSNPQKEVVAAREPSARAKSLPQPGTEKFAGPYIFSGQVTDSKGNPVSFVNIRIRNSAASTYADAKGNYRIMAADSSLTVHFKAYGYQGRTLVLGAAQPVQSVRLQAGNGKERATTLRPKASAKEEMTKKDEEGDSDAKPEAEPIDGWGVYQYYLLNNVRMPADAQQQKLRGTVDISFQVAENGRLTDFRVEKSLSPTCDKEAIRLVREGPAWTLFNAEKPLRARVTVVF